MKIRLVLLTIAVALIGVPASAAYVNGDVARVYMVATGDHALDDNTFRIVQGATYNIEIWMDFSADPTIGGGYDVVFDDEAFDFVTWTSAGLGDPQFERTPDSLPGLLEYAAVGDLDVLTGPNLMATVAFTLTDATALAFGSTISPTATADPGGAWVAAANLILIDPNYSGVTFVPLPAAVWLLASGVLGLVAATRRRR